MNSIKTLLASFFVVALIGFSVLYLYLFKFQTIDLELMPNEFKYCDKVITSNSAEFSEIAEWLADNNSGWGVDWNTPIAGLNYYNPSFRVTVFKGGVAVQYKTNVGYDRLTKSVDHDLEIKCAGVI